MTAATQPQLPTSAELERAAVHEAQAIVEGEDECTCRVRQKVRAAEAARRAS